jgi:threonine dehydrogenase-like Zn-dependent dehydrogenase
MAAAPKAASSGAARRPGLELMRARVYASSKILVPQERRMDVVATMGAVAVVPGRRESLLVLRLRGLDVHVASRGREGGAPDLLLREAGIRYASTASAPLEALRQRVGRIDLVFEATGATEIVVPAMRMLGPNGVCVLSSVTPGEQRVEVDVGTWNREMVLGNTLVFGTVNAGRRHFEAGARDMEAAEQRFPGWLPRLITRRLPFTDAPRALDKRPEDIKTVLEFAS